MSKHGQFNIRRWADPASGQEGISFWCHGCQGAHSVKTSVGGWKFNGDYDRPVIYPSIRVYDPVRKDKTTGQVIAPEKTLCHSFVGNMGAQPGEIIFLGDSQAHVLRGPHPLQRWPDHYGFAGED
jgi:hypothetical protein